MKPKSTAPIDLDPMSVEAIFARLQPVTEPAPSATSTRWYVGAGASPIVAAYCDGPRSST